MQDFSNSVHSLIKASLLDLKLSTKEQLPNYNFCNIIYNLYLQIQGGLILRFGQDMKWVKYCY